MTSSRRAGAPALSGLIRRHHSGPMTQYRGTDREALGRLRLCGAIQRCAWIPCIPEAAQRAACQLARRRREPRGIESCASAACTSLAGSWTGSTGGGLTPHCAAIRSRTNCLVGPTSPMLTGLAWPDRRRASIKAVVRSMSKQTWVTTRASSPARAAKSSFSQRNPRAWRKVKGNLSRYHTANLGSRHGPGAPAVAHMRDCTRRGEVGTA
eukprot:scaffold29504_cov129-Isochrysis_galbana.AAC.1